MAESDRDGAGLRVLRDWVHRKSGILFGEGNLSSLESRLRILCRKHQIPDLATLAKRLDTSPSGLALGAAVLSAATTNHTSFFRERSVLDICLTLVLVDDQTKVRLWSAAASTGEEAYSLAIMAAQRLGGTAAGARVSILGTDISADAVAHSERARYASARDIPDPVRTSYFEEHPSGVEVRPEIRAMCTFRRFNLTAEKWPFTQLFHAVLVRNVLYYFSRETQERLIRRVYEQTLPGGLLLTSVTESLRELDSPWTMLEPGVYQRAREPHAR